MKHILINVGQDPKLLDAALAFARAMGYTVDRYVEEAVRRDQREEAQSILLYTHSTHVGVATYSPTSFFEKPSDRQYADLPAINPAPKRLKLGQYDVTFLPGSVKVGCQTFPDSVVKELARAVQ